MKYLTDQFQLSFCFCTDNTKQPYLFLHSNTIGILTADYSLVDACCICFVLFLHSGI